MQVHNAGAEVQVVGIRGAGFADPIGAEHKGPQRASQLQPGSLLPVLLLRRLAEAPGGLTASVAELFAQQLGGALACHPHQIPIADAGAAPPLWCQQHQAQGGAVAER